jgi:magnesium transporter
VLSIPTIVTSYFGMNVPIPFSNAPWAYLAIIGLFVVLSIGVVFIFLRKNWF